MKDILNKIFIGFNSPYPLTIDEDNSDVVPRYFLFWNNISMGESFYDMLRDIRKTLTDNNISFESIVIDNFGDELEIRVCIPSNTILKNRKE